MRQSSRNLSAWYLTVLLVLATFVGAAAPATAATRADVKAIQTMLNELGYPSGRPDGAMGRKTRAAIRNYQGDHGLLKDGRPSPELREHMEGTVSKRRGTASASAAKPASNASTRTSSKPATKQKTTASSGASGSDRPSLGKAQALRAGTLHQLPSTRATRTGRFAAKTRFDIHKRQGLWIEVVPESGGQGGWARLGTVKLLTGRQSVNVTSQSNSSQQQESGGAFSGLARTLTGWLGGGGQSSSRQASATSTIGIRGLTRNDLTGNGPPDNAALAELDRIATANNARAFARQGGLEGHRVEYPKPPANAAFDSTQEEEEVQD